MVEVWRGVPLAVVRVGKQLKSWSPSLSCCSGPWNVGVGQPSKLVAQQARVAVAQPGCRKLIVVAIAMAMLVTDGKGSVGDAQMVHDFARLGPSLSLFPSLPRVWNIQGRSAGVFQFETSFSSRGEYGSQLALKDGAGTLSCVFCWPGQGYRCQSSDLLRYRG
jgi:hypothetical protein